jgi:hypothetical protein
MGEDIGLQFSLRLQKVEDAGVQITMRGAMIDWA